MTDLATNVLYYGDNLDMPRSTRFFADSLPPLLRSPQAPAPS